MPINKKRFLLKDHYFHRHYDVYKVFVPAVTSYVGGYHHGAYHFGGGYYVTHRGNFSNEGSTIIDRDPPALSDLEAILTEIDVQLNANNPAAVAEILRRDFILRYDGIEDEDSIHLNIPSAVQGHHYRYQVCAVRPVIEHLIHHENGLLFRALLEKAHLLDVTNNTPANEGLHYTIVQQLKNLDLENAHLNGLNLAKANLSHSKAHNARFGGSDLTDAECIETDFIGDDPEQFKGVHISKAQLHACKTYAGAKLSNDYWPYWTEKEKDQILSGLAELKTYGNDLIAKDVEEGIEKGKKAIGKGKKAVALADRLITSINQPGAKYNEAFQRTFYKDLHSEDTTFVGHRNYNRIIANISLFVFTGVLPYLVAGCINMYKTGNFMFFSATKTSQHVTNIDQVTKPRPAVNSMDVFKSGLDPRLGQDSNVHTFFGEMKKVPNNPLGEVALLDEVEKFMF